MSCTNSRMCGLRKSPDPSQEGLEISEWWGWDQRQKKFKESMKLNWNFKVCGGWGWGGGEGLRENFFNDHGRSMDI